MSVFMKVIANPFMKAILLSPLHRLMSKSTAVIFVKGRKSGKVYAFPVNYQRKADTVWITSMRDRSWWKNLRGGAEMSIRLEGRDLRGWGEVFEKHQEVEKFLGEYLLMEPGYAKFFEIGLDEQGDLVMEDLIRAAEERVMIRVSLS